MTSREEVAVRLRASGNWLDEKDTTSMREAMYLINLNVKAPQGREFSLLFNRLADLIDPTCKYLPITCAVWFDDNDEEHEDIRLEAFTSSENASCSVCGYEMMTGEEGWFDYEQKERGNRLIPRFNYCPNCGARVVRDDG